MHSFLQDLRYGFRTMRKSPGFTAIAVITLALGMAANTSMFSIVNGIILRPLPVPNPSQIVVLTADEKDNPLAGRFSYADFVDYRAQSESFAEPFAYRLTLGGLSADNHAESIVISQVTNNYFSALGVKPALGRLIFPTEGQQLGADPIMVLGYSYWQKRFGGDPNIIDKQVQIDGRSMTIVGVTPKGFTGTYAIVDCQAYVPLSFAFGTPQKTKMWSDRAERGIAALARLKPGITIPQARASFNVIAERLAQQYPDTNKGISVAVYAERLARPEPDPDNNMPVISAIFLTLAGLVLLLACFNIANVLLVRATVRHREMAIRAALGGTRGRLIRQWLAESMLLALFGGAGGLLLAYWASNILGSLPLQTNLPLRLDFTPDANVAIYAMAAVFVTAIVVGILPALRVAKTNASDVLREGGRGSTGGRKHWLRNSLVVGQVAGSLLLLIVAGLFTRSLTKVQRLDMGFDATNVLDMYTNVDQAAFSEARGHDFYRTLEARLSALPGVVAVTQSLAVPMGYSAETHDVWIEGKPLAAGSHAPTILYNAISTNYLDVLKMKMVRGREFTAADNEKSTLVAIVNETMAKKLWPNEDAIGKRFSVKSQSGPFVEIVGIAKNGRYRNPDEDPIPFFFLPLEQNYLPFRAIQLKTSVPPEQLARGAQDVFAQLAPGLPVIDVQSMEQSLQGGNGFFIYRFGAQIAAVMGILGLILAIVGVYGVVSYAAAQRVREIGIRIALGAERGAIARLVLGQGLLLVGIGIACGLAAAFAGTRVIKDMFVGISATDPMTFVSVVGILTAVALIACWIPARRAMKVDPMIALRYE